MKTVIRNAAGKPFSNWKPAEKFEHVWNTDGIDGPMTKEFAFDNSRKWRFDFAWPTVKVAVEIDGFGYGHQAQQNIAKGHEKQNAAVLQGWKILRYSSRQLGSKAGVAQAVEEVSRVLCGV